ncbi:MAG: InlB B-repeat-containing protein [Treponema sp.]|nr:InlB B-repeat-containing protein [Treponema sp.]
MKNILIRVLPVLLITLCAILLAIGCPNNPFDQSDTTSGVGTFSLKISGSEQQGRTIMPSDGTDQFGWYRIIFSKAGEDVFDSVRPADQFSAPVELPAGTGYTLKVYAYTIEPGKDTDLPAAYGERTNLSITAGQNVMEVIKLTAFGTTGVDYGGMGIFSWSIGFAQDLYTDSALNLSEVKIGITPIAGTVSPAYNYVLVAENPSVGQKRFTDTQTLGSGYYRVIIELTRANMRTVTWRETLHVYENMTSIYNETFRNDHFIMVSYDVTFDYNDESQTDEFTYFYNHFENPENRIDPTNSNRFLKFSGWYRNKDCTPGNEWNYMLNGHTTLYAKWASKLDDSFNNEHVSFNSNNLIDLGEDFVPEYGWWIQTINGRWLLGEMREGEGKALEMVLIDQTYTNTQLGNTTTGGHNIFPRISSPGPLGGYGTYAALWHQVSSTRLGTNGTFANTFDTSCYYFIFNVTIPNDGVKVWVEAVTGAAENPLSARLDGTGTAAQRVNLRPYLSQPSTVNSTPLIDRPLPLTYGDTTITILNKPGFNVGDVNQGGLRASNQLAAALGAVTVPVGYERPGWIILTPHDSGPQRKFVIEIDATSSWYFHEWIEYGYAVFEQGVDGVYSKVYYWRDEDENLWIFDDQPIQILDFFPGEHEETGTIVVRAYNTAAAGVEWREKPEDMPINTDTMDVIMPEIKEEHYRSIVQDLYIGPENSRIKVGKVTIDITGHAQTGEILAAVDIKAAYELDSDFRAYIENTMTVNSTTVTINEAGIGIVSFNNLHSGNINLNTVFTFKE